MVGMSDHLDDVVDGNDTDSRLFEPALLQRGRRFLMVLVTRILLIPTILWLLSNISEPQVLHECKK